MTCELELRMVGWSDEDKKEVYAKINHIEVKKQNLEKTVERIQSTTKEDMQEKLSKAEKKAFVSTLNQLQEFSESNSLFTRVESVFNDIHEELDKALSKFPEYPTDPIHGLAILGEEYGELNKAVLQYTYEPEKTSKEEIRMEAIQTAAMAIRFLLSLDTFEYNQSKQHKQKL